MGSQNTYEISILTDTTDTIALSAGPICSTLPILTFFSCVTSSRLKEYLNYFWLIQVKKIMQILIEARGLFYSERDESMSFLQRDKLNYFPELEF